MNEESRKKLSEALKAKWASGTRKKNPRSTYEKSSATIKQMIAEGRFSPPAITPEQAIKNRAKADNEKLAAQLCKLNKARKGHPMPPGPSAKGEGHWKSKYWELMGPDRQTYRFVNLNEFIRAHAHLFDPGDLVWRGKGKCACRASKGIRQLYQTRRAPLTWKGWRAIKQESQHPHLVVRGVSPVSHTE